LKINTEEKTKIMWACERCIKYFCESCVNRTDIEKVIKVKVHPHFLYMFKNTSENSDLVGDSNNCQGAKLLGKFHVLKEDAYVYK